MGVKQKKSLDSRVWKSIANWKNYFEIQKDILKSSFTFIAQGGTIDSLKNELNKLSPSPHPLTIEKTIGKNTLQINKLILKNVIRTDNLGHLFPWTFTQGKDIKIPWVDLKFRKSARISSFDSGQENFSHFIASLHFSINELSQVENLIISQGTDTLANKACLFAVMLSPYLYASKKKVIFIGSSESGYVEDSLAISNITGGIYTGLEKQLHGGVYIVTAIRKDQNQVIEILPGLGTVKLHSDGIFHSPNSGAILQIINNRIFKTSLCDDLYERIKNMEIFPYLSRFYFRETTFDRLEKAFKLAHIVSVDNDSQIIPLLYNKGKRIFIIKARGSGTAPIDWKKQLVNIVVKKNVTVLVITSADSGDVNLKKYAAGLDIKKVISGRTLREEAAMTLAVIGHDLKMNEGYTGDDIQQLIDRFCYLSGMIGD